MQKRKEIRKISYDMLLSIFLLIFPKYCDSMKKFKTVFCSTSLLEGGSKSLTCVVNTQ